MKERKVGEYQFWSRIVSHCFLPAIVKTNIGPEPSTGVEGYVIYGSLRQEDGEYIVADENQWSEPPHIAFANLRADDARAVEAFIRRYGLLSDLSRFDPKDEKKIGNLKITFEDGQPQYEIVGERPYFSIEGAHVLLPQDQLRRAWQDPKGAPFDRVQHALATEDIERQVEDFAANVDVSEGGVQLHPKDLWTLICFLFLRDYIAGRLGICENPDCPAPYFRKNRRTQKFCEAGPCTAYAARLYTKTWWDKKGKKQRAKKQPKRRGGKS